MSGSSGLIVRPARAGGSAETRTVLRFGASRRRRLARPVEIFMTLFCVSGEVVSSYATTLPLATMVGVEVPIDEFRANLRGLLRRSRLSMRQLSAAFGRDKGYVASLLDPAR